MNESPFGSEYLIDSHCHLQMEAFAGDLDQVLERARVNSVRYVVVPGSDRKDNERGLVLAERRPELYVACGIHPHDASAFDQTLASSLAEWLEHPKAVAVGETGLDYHYMNSPKDVQVAVFEQHLDLAEERNLPVVIHSREAGTDTLDILEARRGRLHGVLHCFSGDVNMAHAILDLGYYISIAGPVTYPKAVDLRQVVLETPIERLLIETDAPYLAPVPYRGKRNEPAHLVHTALEVSRLKGLHPEDVARITSLNARRLFGIRTPEESSRIAYRIRDSLYLNLTNRCTNRCCFCVRQRDPYVKGHNLCLDREPSALEIIAAIGDPSPYKEVVFCGYGEPLLRLETVREVAQWLKERHARIRVNTNGQASLFHGRDVIPELSGLVDEYSVSLNAPDREEYNRLCSPENPSAWDAMLDFIRRARESSANVSVTAVAIPGVDMDACRALASELGVSFRPRAYNDIG